MSYFTAVRLYSLFELCLFTALVVLAIGGWSDQAELVLGWSHGVGWILLCLAVAAGCRGRVFPWPLLAATVSPLGPLGSTVGIEYLSRRRARAGAAPGDVAGQPGTPSGGGPHAPGAAAGGGQTAAKAPSVGG